MMQRSRFLLICALAMTLVLALSCKKEEDEDRNNPEPISGSLNGTLPAGVYRVTGDLRIGADSTLTVSAGTTFLFEGPYGLYIAGELHANGSERDSIIFARAVGNTAGWRGLNYDCGGGLGGWLRYCRISGTVLDSARQTGHAVRCALTVLELSNCLITDNRARGLLVMGEHVTVQNCIISYNTALAAQAEDTVAHRDAGGGILATDGSLLLRFSTISDNVSLGGGGGLSTDYVTAVITSCQFLRNVTTGGDGGGLECNSSESTTLADCIAEGNRAPAGSGGGLALWDADFSAERCTFRGNEAGLSGGGLRCVHANGTTTSCWFENNQAGEGAGAAVASGGTDSFLRSVFVLNRGTGLTVNGYTSCDVERCTFVANRGVLAGAGGGIVALGGSVRLNSSIVAHSAPNGMYFYGAEGTLSHNDFFGNNQDFAAGGDSNVPEGAGVLTTVNANGDSSDVYMNIFRDPMLADTTSGDMHLQAGSPCIDAGDPALLHDTDGSVADIGAYTFEVTP